MSVLDAFFGRAGVFRGARCKTLLKLTIPRIKLLRNRRVLQLKQMRRDIANLLSSGQEATARIRVEHIIREENMMAAQEILELFCELIVVRLPIIESQRECPLDLKEAISSICFAAPRCADLPELQQAQMMFSSKYGKDFVNAAAELLPDSGVNRQIVELLSVRAPATDAKLKLLKEIAEEHEVDWDPTDSETTYEDLLNGPGHLINPPPLQNKASHEFESDSHDALDFLDLPEVPRAFPTPTTEHNETPASKASDDFHPFIKPPSNLSGLSPPNLIVPPPQPGAPPLNLVTHLPSESSLSAGEEGVKLSTSSESTPAILNKINEGPVLNSSDQFLPFFTPPPPKQEVHPPNLVTPPPNKVALSPPEPSLPEVEEAEKLSLASESTPAILRKRGELDKELQDAVAAANAAAETAERAAAAARLAASLAQVKMAELVGRTGPFSEETEKVSHYDDDAGDRPVIPLQTAEDDSSGMATRFPDDSRTLRSLSMDDDPYFSYPNLFSRQNSSAMEHSPIDHSKGT
ncbi:uncharacterized protein LOC144711200 [Wolffia australiana]